MSVCIDDDGKEVPHEFDRNGYCYWCAASDDDEASQGSRTDGGTDG